MTKPRVLCAALLALLHVGPVAAQSPSESRAEEDSSLADALKGGEVQVGFRYRFEHVDEDRFSGTAEASTLRTSLAYSTGEWKGWSAFLEAEDVTAIFDDDGYNNAGAGDLDNGVRGVPIIADPEDTELNQAFVRWRGKSASFTVGRQEINLGDQRFVGAVGWRQNHQSFDALRLRFQATERVGLDYTFADAALRIFGDHAGMSSHFLLVPIELTAGHRLSVFGFWLDFDTAVTSSSSTFGLEYSAKLPISDRFDLRLEAEIARQDDIEDNPLTIDTSYLLASVGGDWRGLGFDVTWESLGERGDGARAFQTPLATLHKWNGWADRFLQTPSLGLETLYLRIKGAFGSGFRWSLIYHDFQSAAGDRDYGTEIDGELTYTTAWHQTFAVKLAAYDAEDFSTDTEKLIFWTAYKF